MLQTYSSPTERLPASGLQSTAQGIEKENRRMLNSKGIFDRRNTTGAPEEYYKNDKGILEHKRSAKGILQVYYRNTNKS
eukprot:4482903-Amphidinium_carterae.1